MSKITPKNLQYDSTLPPFLARMQANNTSRDGRHEFSTARPKKARNAEDDAEEEPVYFDEGTGETLTKGEWEEREKVNAGDEEVGAEKDGMGSTGVRKDGESKEGAEKIAAIGGSRKRKGGKVIGGEDEEGKEGVVLKDKKDSKAEGNKPEKGKAAKKGKKIKLSFGDDE